MLDQRKIRENPTLIEKGLARRGLKVNLAPLTEASERLKGLEQHRNSLQAKGNLIGKEVGQKIKSGISPNSEEVVSLRSKGNELKREINVLEEEEKALAKSIRKRILNYPNIPYSECPDGKDENDNLQIRNWGNPLKGEGYKEHWEIAEELGLLDTEKSVRIAKSRFVTLFNHGARLERSLINFMLDIHTSKGYSEVLPPVLVNTASLEGSGQLPKFAEESFKCSEDDLWLTPTAEVPLTSLHRNEVIPFEKLPIKYVAYSPCFRREAGSYGRDTRGLIRLHQFNKVELYWFVEPKKSKEAHQIITADAEAILQKLELPYRVVELCSGDLGFSASCTYDLEVWLPGANSYREISSCSNCDDFQARRSFIRTKKGNQTQLVHTLNASGLAIGRTMAAILENGQQSDGTVKLPKALVPYFGENQLTPQ
ncbi:MULTISPECIES: serine--tRNA ligase [Prochlorococcus]|uniref:Serine--tRNA ligase n=1 Tax=Prochlorococcus marinus (strain SARG / CCMP1375 / SS120) TaxID=167539 RepID=SYS_PROMA|nr:MULTISPECIES: serine--tRNA ligase [Prochlorococcus]Q7VAZ8.1 RecName: Full=Serine--tRNA ligase; AltName: Full=Seryl-tRNA synthetase; Short=SerRS; AltName: Full=Seryl-tRNA(Ser/Sec) synthetase [Prochlorococcus marinus subsp. marinus str. CCMP1375]AAQ00348.1 Seryl-tRNA synthetase [Prochlorococcus marinus subsp. marinus str. CCMP1375]KGG14228.1 Seryl-tRNA synthetase [Prochlorococcus marinus str. LG]KGG22200.1 Seryl-tRNA synthetase [Prochlorococcus marinus str. SS2]KGG24483.1 Seryl-tRNA synthetas